MPDASSFNRVFAAATWQSGNDALLLLARPNALDYPRLGLVVGKKNQPRAVDRNRTRRQAREVFRQMRDRLPDADFVVISRRGIRASDRHALRAQLEQLFSRIARKASNAPT